MGCKCGHEPEQHDDNSDDWECLVCDCASYQEPGSPSDPTPYRNTPLRRIG